MVFGGVEIDKEIVDFVEHFLCAGIGAVDLVQHDYRRQLGCQRFLQNIARLRQRPFARVDQNHDAVHHAQCALHFAAKVAVAGRVHDIDLRVVKKKSGIFRQNGDPALAFQVVGIHHALDDGFIRTKNPALPEHGVHQRGLAVVHVRDDGDVANLFTHNSCLSWPFAAKSLLKTKIAAETTSSLDECPFYVG